MYIFWLYSFTFHFKTVHNRKPATFAVFGTKIAWDDVTKTEFSKNCRERLSLCFPEGRYFRTKVGTQVHVTISGSFESLKKSGEGGERFTPSASY